MPTQAVMQETMRVAGLRASNEGDGLRVRLEWTVTGTPTFDYSVIEAYDRYKGTWVPFDGYRGVVELQKTAVDDNPPQSVTVEARQPLPGVASFRVRVHRRVGDIIQFTPWEQVAVDVFVDLVTGDRIADGAITAPKISHGAITSEHITIGAITTEHIAAGTVIAAKIEADSIAAEHIQAGAIEAEHISAGAIQAGHISAGAIQAGHIDAEQITSGHIQADSILAGHIAAGEINAKHIAAGSITAESAIIADAAITNAKIADATITDAKIAVGTITGAKIGTGEITTALIKDANITSAKIAEAAIETAHIKEAAITTAKIGDLQVTNAKVAGDLDAAKIATGYLSADRIEAGTISGSKLTIGDFSNLVPNPAFRTGNVIDWDGLETVLPATDALVPAGAPGGFVASIPVGVTDTPFYASNWIDVEPDEKYYVSIQASSTADASGNLTVGVVARKEDGTVTMVPVATRVAPDTSWGLAAGEATVPAGHYQIRFWGSVAGDAVPSGSWFVTLARLRKKYGATLIEDGSISTGHIQAGAITADHLNASVIDAIDARIDNIDAGVITTGTLDADRVTINSSAGGAGVGLQLNSAGMTLTLDEMNVVRLDASGIRISSDGGQTWSTKLDAGRLYVTTADIDDLSVTTAKIANAAIGTAKIGDAQITSAKILDGTIQTADIGNAQITTALIADAQITSALIADATITNADILDATIQGAKIGDAQITSAKIMDGTIQTADIGNAQITSAKIGNAQITTALIADAQITGAKIAEATITDAHINDLAASKLTAGTINADIITIASKAGGMGDRFLIDTTGLTVRNTDSITPTTKLLWITSDGLRVSSDGGNTWTTKVTGDGLSVVSADIGDAQITTAKIADATIISAHILDGTIGTADIGNAQITTAKIGDAQITSALIENGTIQTADIGNAQITSALIQDATITNTDIANATIQGAKIADATITSAKITDATIQAADIGDAQITTAKIGDAQITTAKIGDLQVTGAKIAEATITDAHINDLSASKLTAGTIDADSIAIAASAGGLGDRFIIDSSGLTVRDTDTIIATTKVVWITSDGIKVSADGGATWTTKLTGDGLSVLTADIGDAQITSAKIASAQIQSAHIVDGTIQTADIGNAQITSAKIGDAQISSAHIVDGTIQTADIGNAQITSAKIADATIVNADIANATIQGAKIANATITSANILDGTIQTADIGNAQITSAKIESGAIGTALIADGAITSAKIFDATIGSADIADASIVTAKIGDLAVTSAKIAEVSASKLAAGTINTDDITIKSLLKVEDNQATPQVRAALGDISSILGNPAGTNYGLILASPAGATMIDDTGVHTEGVLDSAIITEKLGNLAVTEPKLGDGSVTNAKIDNAAITTAKIDTAAITTALIADAAINSAKILDATIASADIADLAVINAKIGNAAVTNAKIGNLAVSSAQIQDAAITSAKIADATIQTVDIKDAAITTAKIGNLQVTGAKIADATITNAKISDLDASKLTAGTIDADSITIAALAGGTANRFFINTTGLTVQDKDTVDATTKMVRIDSGGIKVSVDGGTTWATKLTGSGLSVVTADIGDAQITSAKIVDGTIQTADIGNAQITSAKIVDGTIQTADIGDAQITTAKIGEAQITSAEILNGTIASADIANLAVITAKIGEAAVTNAKIANLAVSTAQIQESAITSAKIANLTVTDADIANSTITTAKIGDLQVTGAKIADATITNAKITDLSADKLTAGTIDADSITIAALAGGTGNRFFIDTSGLTVQDKDTVDATTKMVRIDSSGVKVSSNGGSTWTTKLTGAGLSVVTADIGDAQITSAKIMDGTIQTADIANAQITSAKIVDGTILTADIGDAQITTAKIGSAQITSALIADATIQTADIKDAQITSAKILDASITNTDIANATIQGAKIANATITDAQIASGTITNAQIAQGTILTANIGDAQITNVKVASGLDAAKITVGILDAARIAAGSITADKLTIGRIPHAINPVTDHLFHFDRDLASTQGVQPLDGYVATLRREGRFGQAVAVEEGTTNQILEARRHDVDGWTTLNHLDAGTKETEFGPRIVWQVTQGAYAYIEMEDILGTYADGELLSASIYVWVNKDVTLSLRFFDNHHYFDLKAGKWNRLMATEAYKSNPSFTAVFLVDYRVSTIPDGLEVMYWGAQLEAKPFPTSFVDGTRAEGKLEYPTSLLIGNWTFSAWLKRNYTGLYQGVAGFGSQSDSDFLYWILNYSGQIYLGLKVDGTVFFQSSWGDDPHINDTENWHHHVVQVDNDALKARYFIDGVLSKEVTLPSPVPSITKYQSFGLGRYYTSSGIKSILFDELLILPYAASEEEIRSWYVMGAPFYDPSRLITGTTIDDDTITTRHIRANSITADHIQAGTITSDSAIVASLNADKITAGTLNVGLLTAISAPFGSGSEQIHRFKLDSSSLIIQSTNTVTDTTKMVRIDSDGIWVSQNGGQSWSAKLTGDGLRVVSADIAELAVTNAHIASGLDASKITVGELDGGLIRADTITGTHIVGNSITASHIQTDAIIAKFADINQAIITDAHIANLSASKITTGTMSGARIAAGTITTAHLAAASITTDKIAVGSRANLINNFSVSGNLTGWSGSGTLVDEVTKDGVIVKTLKVVTSGSVQITSAWFEVDPTKTYEVHLSIYSDHPDVTGTRYFGLHAGVDGTTTIDTIPVVPFVVSSRVFGNQTANPYFWSGEVYGGSWRDMTAYILGCNVTADEVQPGKNVTNHFKMLPNTKYVRIRFLNYYNDGVTVTNHFFSPSVSLAPATVLTGDSITTGTLHASQVRVLSGNPTGNRIVLDGEGLRAYGSEGETVNVSATTGDVRLRGSIRASQFVLPVRAT